MVPLEDAAIKRLTHTVAAVAAELVDSIAAAKRLARITAALAAELERKP